MRSDVPLHSTPVYRNLDYRWSWYGLTLGDVPFAALPGLVLLAGSIIFEYSVFWAVFGFLAAAVGIALLKWRKPEGYIEVIIHLALTPRRLSHKERDRIVRPFPVAPRPGSSR